MEQRFGEGNHLTGGPLWRLLQPPPSAGSTEYMRGYNDGVQRGIVLIGAFLAAFWFCAVAAFPRLHLPLPSPKQASLGAAASALQEGIEIRERGCDCVVWPAGPSDDLALRHGVLSVERAASPVAERLGQEEDTVVLELAAGSYSFLVGAG